MPNIYKVEYEACIKTGPTGTNQLRQQVQSKVVFVSATSEANAVSAVKSAEPRNGQANIEYCRFSVTVVHPDNLVGS